jgi:hypothetical protein
MDVSKLLDKLFAIDEGELVWNEKDATGVGDGDLTERAMGVIKKPVSFMAPTPWCRRMPLRNVIVICGALGVALLVIATAVARWVDECLRRGCPVCQTLHEVGRDVLLGLLVAACIGFSLYRVSRNRHKSHSRQSGDQDGDSSDSDRSVY